MSQIGYDTNVNLMVKQWNELKDDLYNGKVNYKDIKKLRKDYMFFNRFDNMFQDSVKNFEISLESITLLYRGVGEEVLLDDYERMIPKEKCAKGYNRMNPPGQAFIYLGILGENKGRDKKTVKNFITKTLLKELRTQRCSTATICQFQVTNVGKNKTVIDFRGDTSIPKEDAPFNSYMENQILKSRGKETRLQVVYRVLTKHYFNLFSSYKIFKPIETDDQDVKKYEYAPFHTLANYVREQGYAGIIFNSTVHNNGTNLVLFDTDDVSVIPNSMEHVQASDYI